MELVPRTVHSTETDSSTNPPLDLTKSLLKFTISPEEFLDLKWVFCIFLWGTYCGHMHVNSKYLKKKHHLVGIPNGTMILVSNHYLINKYHNSLKN